MRAFAPEVVFHLAAQPLVRAGYREPVATFATNVMGTVHVLEALRGVASMRVAVMVTTDKVYRNPHPSPFTLQPSTFNPQPFSETAPLGGHDPYSASKAACEIAIESYRESFLRPQGVAVASARAGNVIGGGDWSEDRLIPDAVRAWSCGDVLELRYPEAVRPWQHVLEPLAGYLRLAEGLWENPDLADAYNFAPAPEDAVPVREVVALAQAAWGDGAQVVYAARADDPPEAAWLALDAGKAAARLGVAPRWKLEEAVTRTIRWYRSYYSGENARRLCQDELAAYEAC